MATRVCARKSAMIGTERMIAGGITRNDQTSVEESVVGPTTFNSGVEEIKARASNASTSRGVEAANRIITEQRRSTREPARRAAAIPSVSESDTAINKAQAVNTMVRNKGKRTRFHTGV